jgi:Family of unknown function (DUF5362)
MTGPEADGHRIPFSPGDEERIASTGLWGMIVAITSIASTLLSTGTSMLALYRLPGGAADTLRYLSLIPVAIGLTVQVLLGIWLLQASLAFRRVALTDEADQQHLLRGFGKLRNYFMLIGILVIIGVTVGVLFLVGAMTCGSMLR